MKKPLFLFLFVFPAFLSAQNLVDNPGFEDFANKSIGVSTMEYCIGWLNPTMASPDYFNPLLEYNAQMVHPKNWWGYQEPQYGLGYAGFIAYRSGDNKTMSEYIEAHFSQPLIAGELYNISFGLSLAECSSLSLNEMGAYLANEPVYMKTVSVLKFKPQVILPIKNCDTASWAGLNATYKAKGGEQYMVIGFFDYDQHVHLKKETPSASITGPRNEAYYFIDDVSVIPVKPGLHSPPDTATRPITDTAETKIAFDDQTPIVLENVVFEKGSDVLMVSSYEELNKMAAWLLIHSRQQAEVNGYTDNEGSEKQNTSLSLRRSMAVCNYITQKGVDQSRLKAQGFGEANPRASNETEEGKALNRRVEIKIF